MYNESQIRYLVLQIFKAIKYLKIKNFLHIEISPEKILIYDITKDSHGEELYNIKLLDFFCPSRNNVVLDNKSSFFCYMAPEVIEQKYNSLKDLNQIDELIEFLKKRFFYYNKNSFLWMDLIKKKNIDANLNKDDINSKLIDIRKEISNIKILENNSNELETLNEDKMILRNISKILNQPIIIVGIFQMN